MKPVFEQQLEVKGGSWFLTVTISAGEYYWTSRPFMLDAETEEEAAAEAARQVVMMRKALG